MLKIVSRVILLGDDNKPSHKDCKQYEWCVCVGMCVCVCVCVCVCMYDCVCQLPRHNIITWWNHAWISNPYWDFSWPKYLIFVHIVAQDSSRQKDNIIKNINLSLKRVECYDSTMLCKIINVNNILGLDLMLVCSN